MARLTGEVRRLPPIAVGRAFGVAFRRRLRVDRRAPLRRGYRDEVDRQLVAEFGVPLPTALDWLIAAACRREVPVDEMTAFLGQLFDLEPLNVPASRRSR